MYNCVNQPHLLKTFTYIQLLPKSNSATFSFSTSRPYRSTRPTINYSMSGGAAMSELAES